MAKEFIKIELDENDIKCLVSQKYNLDPDKTSVSIIHYEGDVREPSYTKITVEGLKTIS